MTLPAALHHANWAHATRLAALLRTALLPVSKLHAGGSVCDWELGIGVGTPLLLSWVTLGSRSHLETGVIESLWL